MRASEGHLRHALTEYSMTEELSAKCNDWLVDAMVQRQAKYFRGGGGGGGGGGGRALTLGVASNVEKDFSPTVALASNVGLNVRWKRGIPLSTRQR
jgi:hypothetical protein